MNEPFLGMIALFGFGFPPRDWAVCDGSILPIAQNTALFSLLGTTYGGNGQTTFALPDLRSRVPLGQGQGPGLSPYQMGQVGGTESVTLTTGQMPMHTHTLTGTNAGAATSVPNGNVLAASNGALEDGTTVSVNAYATSGTDATLNPSSIGVAGGSQPVQIQTPYLAMNYCIALKGIFPSRS
ncbi:phage tail protein [Spirosoma jeollabukense]